MKIRVDVEKCVGAGQCAMVAPTVFDQDDDDGTVIVLESNPGPEHAHDVGEAVMLCPAQVIVVED